MRILTLPTGASPEDAAAIVGSDEAFVPAGYDVFADWLRRGGLRVSVLADDQIPPPGVVVLPAASALIDLKMVCDTLVGPGGCPWDQAQTHRSLRPYLLEESYELFDAIDREDSSAIRDELGDVLLQPFLHSALSHRDGHWDVEVVARRLVEKLIRRHPHVFGDASADSAEDVLTIWNEVKAQETDRPESVLDSVPASLPALARAQKISKIAARNGFEWPDLAGVWEKFREEERELQGAETPAEQEAELGDLLFTTVNLARWLRIDAELALHGMLSRFIERFQWMERRADRPLGSLTAAEWDALWNEAKAAQKGGTSPLPAAR